MAGSYLTRARGFLNYSPLISVGCLVFWIIGLALWVHYTVVAYSKANDVIDILQAATSDGVLSQMDRVQSVLVATAVVYSVFALAIHGLGVWRGMIESEQDMEGRLDESRTGIFVWANMVLQVCWWLVMAWLSLVLITDGAFAAVLYWGRSVLQNVYNAQTILPNGLDLRLTQPGQCPIGCLDTVSSGLFTYLTDSSPAAALTAVKTCVCDFPTIKDALASADDAWTAVPGMLIGVMLMKVYGTMLASYLSSMFSHARREQDISERLANGGAAGGVKAYGR